MSEVQYVWADPSSGEQQIIFSSLVQAMLARDVAAIVRWVSRDAGDPKMGVLIPRDFEKVDCFLWVQVRRMSFRHTTLLRQISIIFFTDVTIVDAICGRCQEIYFPLPKGTRLEEG